MLEFNSDGTTRSEVLAEILSDSTSTRVFGSQALPASEYPNQSIKYFDVDTGGTVYALVDTHQTEKASDKQGAIWQYFIERFNSDGSTDSVVRLDYPPGTGSAGLGFYHFGVFRDGSFIVAGTNWAPPTGSEPVTAVYDSRGKFIQTVRLPNDVLGGHALKPANVSSAQRDAAVLAIMVGSMVSSPDGNVYLLRNSQPVRIYGVDSAGEVVKHFQLLPPAPGMSVSSAGLAAEDSLFLYFGRPVRPGEKPISEYLAGIFNTASGQFDAIYKLPTKEFRVPACGDQHGGLLFIGSSTDNHLAVFDYGP